MAELPRYKVFVSSPSDVRPERLIARRVIERLDRDLQYHCRVESVLWERRPLKATVHFQHADNIPAPRATDIAIVILWSRLGVTLPTPDFLGAKTGRAVTGTEWEFEDAWAASEARGLPDLLVYRKTAPALATVGDEAEERNRQKRLVDDFVTRWFINADGTFRAASSEFSDPAEFEELLYTHLRAKLLERLGNPVELHAVRWHQGSPFRGLESFGPEHAQVFFGRRRARDELRDALTVQLAAGRPVLLVMGASGSGKSSLVKAGLLPDLLLPGMLPDVGLVRWGVMRPADRGDPMKALRAALASPTALPGLAPSIDTVDPPGLVAAVAGALAATAREVELAPPWQPRLVLIVDQLEELFAQAVSADSRAAFAAVLEDLALRAGVIVIATLRSDFFPVLEALPSLATLTAGAGRILLLPPDDAEIGEIILGPAQEAGLVFEPALDSGRPLNETLRQDAATEPGVLPLLEFTLDQLWHRRAGNQLTHAAYQDLGGLKGAIGRRAETLLAQQPPAVQAALPRLLFALARAEHGEDGRILARAATVPEGTPEHRLAAAMLAPDARLLIADDGGILRVAHEALLTHWPKAKAIIETARVDLQLRERLAEAAREWSRETGRHKTGLLLRQPLLAQARDLVARRGDELDPAIATYVAESTRWDRRQVRRLRIAAGGFAALAVAAAVGAWFGFTGQMAADARRIEAESNLAVAQNITYTVVGDTAARIAAVDDLPREQRRRIVERSEQLFAMLSRTSAGTPALHHERAVALNAFADAWLALDEPATAMARAVEARAVLAGLTAAHPDQPDWLRSLALSAEKEGDARQALGDLGGALMAFQETLRIAQDRLALAPADPERVRDTMLAHGRLAIAKLRRDGATAAAPDFRAALGLAERRAANAADAGAQRDLQWIREQMAAAGTTR